MRDALSFETGSKKRRSGFINERFEVDFDDVGAGASVFQQSGGSKRPIT